MNDYPKHYCGIFGVYGHPNAAELTYYGLYALQHRGQESAGIVTSDGKQFHIHKGMGLVSQIFKGGILQQAHDRSERMAEIRRKFLEAPRDEDGRPLLEQDIDTFIARAFDRSYRMT